MFNNLKSLSRSCSLIYLYIFLVTVLGELFSPFKKALASLTGHHWVSKGITSIILFLILNFIFNKVSEASSHEKNVSEVFWSLIIFTVLMTLFFCIFYFFH